MYNGVEGKPTYMYDVISTSLTFAVFIPREHFMDSFQEKEL